MAAPSMAPVPSERRDLDPAEFRKHGMIAGLLGAAVLAGWFLILDLLRGQPLATPTFLARVVLSGGASETFQSVEGSIGPTVVFTIVHALAFAVIGVTVAEFLRRFDLVHSKALTVVLLVGSLCIAFVTFALMFAAVGADGITLRDAFIGNVLASFAMTGYLGRVLGAEQRV